MSAKPLIAHVVFRFDYGGLENGLVNLVNSLADDPFDHAIIALSESTEFSRRLREGVPVFSVGKRPGKDIAAYLRLFRLLRTLKPRAVHTRNIGTLDCAFVAFLARVPARIHGEHGWDIFDPAGTSGKYRALRRVLARLIQRFVVVSEELEDWLETVVGIPAGKITRIRNGVDTRRFRPRDPAAPSPLPATIFGSGTIVVGSVTRFAEIKDPLNLIEAFLQLRSRPEQHCKALRLLMIGDGELRGRAVARLAEAGASDVAWLPGSRDDVAELMPAIDIFVLGSRREGISNTVLEAMASGLPVVATATGGNPELIASGQTGALVPPGDSRALASAIERYAADPALRARHGRAARARATEEFSLTGMVENYRRLYDRALTPLGA